MATATQQPKSRTTARRRKNAEESKAEEREQEAAGGETPAEEGPLLDLSTTPERPIIRIDKEPYELAVKNDFGIEDQHALTAWGRRYDELFKRNKLTDKESGQLKILLDDMFELVACHIPEDVQDKLGDEHRSQVVLAFTYAPVAKALAQLQIAQAATDEVQKARDSSTSES